MKNIPIDELRSFKKIKSCEGKTPEWMANHYLISKGNNREDVMRLLRLHAGYQAYIVKDESWEPLYKAFKKRNIAQIKSIAEEGVGKPRDDHPEFSWSDLSPYILQKADSTAKLDFTIYALGHKDKNNGDEWSKKFKGFKERNIKDVIGGQRLLSIIVKFVIETNNLGKNVGLLTALSHNKETEDSTSLLFKTASAISKIWNIKFFSTSLTKKIHFPLKKQFNYENRQNQIAGCYSCSKLENVENIIILDDFTTTGLTFKEIARAIREKNRSMNIYGVVLAIHPKKFVIGMNNKIPTLFEKFWCSNFTSEEFDNVIN